MLFRKEVLRRRATRDIYGPARVTLPKYLMHCAGGLVLAAVVLAYALSSFVAVDTIRLDGLQKTCGSQSPDPRVECQAQLLATAPAERAGLLLRYLTPNRRVWLTLYSYDGSRMRINGQVIKARTRSDVGGSSGSELRIQLKLEGEASLPTSVNAPAELALLVPLAALLLG